MNGALGDSPLLFHRALNEGIRSRVQQLANEHITGRVMVGNYHVVCAAGLNETEAEDTEEYLVEKYSFTKSEGLNMIPGGRAGIAYLHKLNVLLDEKPVLLDEDREKLLGNYFREHPRKGLPNPLIAEYWRDEDFAARVICSGDNRLTVKQVRDIRTLAALGHSCVHICHVLGITNELQVRKVLSGKTYGRVH
jgi:hypothetical protein